MPGFEETYLPGDSIPFRRFPTDPIQHVKKTDGPEAQPRVQMDVVAEVFDLSKAEDLEKYNEALDLIGKREWQISAEQIQFSPQTGRYVAFLRRVRPYRRAVKQNGAANESGLIVR